MSAAASTGRRGPSGKKGVGDAKPDDRPVEAWRLRTGLDNILEFIGTDLGIDEDARAAVADVIDPFDELAPWFMAPSSRSSRTAAQHPVRRW
jgi:hypothetical protein